MPNVDAELRLVEEARSLMQTDEPRVLLHAYDGIATVLLAILQELREARQKADRSD